MAASQIGADMLVGATSTVSFGSNYIVESCTQGDKQVDFEDVFDSNGAISDRIVFSKLPKISATLICKEGADPVADFIPGGLVSGTTYIITSAASTKTKSPWRVQVEAVDYSLALVV